MLARCQDSLEKKAVDNTAAFKAELLDLNQFNVFLAAPELRSF